VIKTGLLTKVGKVTVDSPWMGILVGWGYHQQGKTIGSENHRKTTGNIS
jgi:hypothetical protein